MRQIHDQQLQFGQVPIEEIRFVADSRDDIPAILRGLQQLYCTPSVYRPVMALLKKELLAKVDARTGRPGLDLWQILVLGILKQGLRIDFDRLRELANEHRTLQHMLGHGLYDETHYRLQRLVDNVSLLTPSLLQDINGLLVRCGHAALGESGEAELRGRCDSFVVETDVHYPTDVSLLWDALRGLLRSTGRSAGKHGVGGWRQWRQLTRRVRRRFQAVRETRRAQGPQIRAYLRTCRILVGRSESSLKALQAAGLAKQKVQKMEGFIGHAQRQIEQVDRRLLKGETIPHEEKVFSVFEEHTRWIAKGKAGVAVELGVPVCVVEDQHQFVLHYKVLWEGSDVDVAVPMIRETQQRYPELKACSFDRGLHSPENRVALDRLLERNALSGKGKLSKANREREAAPAFREARRQHPAVEAAINHLEHHGLDRVRSRGADGFERTVALSVLGANIHRLGKILLAKERKQARRRAARLAA